MLIFEVQYTLKPKTLITKSVKASELAKVQVILEELFFFI